MRLLVLLLALLAPLAAAAQQPAAAPATAEILPGWQRADGTRVAGLRIRLAPGWKTYWRSPGDAGIPPQFDWRRSRNLRFITLDWPAPRVIAQNGLRTIGYHDEVIFPLTLAARDPGRPVDLRGRLEIGVCRDVCVPVALDVAATLDGDGSTPTPAIAAALAARPLSAAEAGLRAATCALRPRGDGIGIELHLALPRLGPEEVVVIEPGSPGVWASETTATRDGGTLRASGTLVPTGGGAAIDRSALRITVIAGGQAAEITGCAPA